jgi:hypothetical protein
MSKLTDIMRVHARSPNAYDSLAKDLRRGAFRIEELEDSLESLYSELVDHPPAGRMRDAYRWFGAMIQACELLGKTASAKAYRKARSEYRQ